MHLTYSDIEPFVLNTNGADSYDEEPVRFHSYVPDNIPEDVNFIKAAIPLHVLCDSQPIPVLREIASRHGISIHENVSYSKIIHILKNHSCQSCPPHVSILERPNKINENSTTEVFPPEPMSVHNLHEVTKACASEFDAVNVQEAGCAVCGVLTLEKCLTPLTNITYDLNILQSHLTRKERKAESDAVEPIAGPILDPMCTGVCSQCDNILKQKEMPLNALANGLWVGEIPEELQNLTFAEQMLIPTIRHNRCLVRVSSGRAKMIANVVMLNNPIPQIYKVLPPPRSELDEVLAFVYLGSTAPTPDDFARTPLLVRRNKVANALNWLKLNHRGYEDLIISNENLLSYPEHGIPVAVDFRQTESDSNKLASEMSLNDNEIEEGTEDGPCPFTVHALTGEEYSTLSPKAMKAMALRHLQAGGKVLGIGHDGNPLSMYDNPDAYPNMFPWLFPYGYGGLGQHHLKRNLSEVAHKKHLLLYHDKRFQMDVHFPIIAFNHEQMKSAITGSFLASKRSNFASVADRLSRLDPHTLVKISASLRAGDRFKPVTEEEKLCYSILNDLDH
ncbi:hypothetical protein GALMADRAFT_74100, partial [Galerina marginata CBS 339.88]